VSQYFEIHPDNPQPRLIQKSVEMIRGGAVIAYPTDSAYALGCHIGDKKALDIIRAIRKVDDKHNFTLVCRDLSEIATYAKIDNAVYRFLNAHTPGAYTYILKATREVPKRLMHPRRRTIGIRVPDNKIVQSLLAHLQEPIMSTTLILPDKELPMTEAYDIRETLEHQLDLIIDGGHCGLEATTVIDLTEHKPQLIREGCGDPTPFLV